MKNAGSGQRLAVNSGVSRDKSDNVPKEKRLENVVKKGKQNKRKNALIASVILLVLLAAGGFLCYTKLFKISKLEISGDCPYTKQQMLDGMGLKIGDTLYGVSDDEIRHNAKYNLAYIKDIKISRIWPSTVKVTVKKETPAFYTSIDDGMYILSQDLRVLSKTDNIEDVEIGNLVYFEITGIKSCVEGEQLTGDEKLLSTLKTLHGLLVKYNVFDKITNINMKNRFDIRMTYGTKFTVKLGDEVNLETKIKFMMAIIQELGTDITGGIIDVSDEDAREGTFEHFT